MSIPNSSNEDDLNNSDNNKTIPDEDFVYLRIHKDNIDFTIDDPHEKIKPMAFDPKGDDGGLSVDWSKYAAPEDTHNRARIPAKNGVLSMNVGNIKKAPFDCSVIHKPVTIEGIENYAHSLINGVPPRKPNGLQFRIQLRQICNWEIDCNKE